MVFHPLTKPEIRQIARIQLRGLEKRLAERQVGLTISEKALDLLGNVGFDPVYGARPLKRAIQQQVENPLSREILEGNFPVGLDRQRGCGAAAVWPSIAADAATLHRCNALERRALARRSSFCG